MAMLHKILIHPNERVDKSDWDKVQDFVGDDFKAYNRHFLTNATKQICKGFVPSVLGGTQISIGVAGSVLLNTAEVGGNEFYLGEDTHAPLTNVLADGATSYVHLKLTSGSGTSAVRVLWDPTLNSGQGGEFLQTVDTDEFLDVELFINTTGFVSDADKLPLCEVVCAGGIVTNLYDRRNLFFRLGRGEPFDNTFNFALNSPAEPNDDLIADGFAFTGGDKQLGSFKQWMDLVMTRFKDISGEDFWFENTGGFNVQDLYTDLGNTVLSGGGTIEWTVGNTFTFSSGLLLKVIGLAGPITYTIPVSQSGQGLANDQVAYVNIDAELGGPGSGQRGISGDRELLIGNRGAVPFDQNIFWVAYREGTKLFVRSLDQELESGEQTQIGDGITAQLLTYIGSPSETTSTPIYSSTHFVSGSLTTAIGALDTGLYNHETAGDPHTMYILASGTRAFTGDQSMGGHYLTNVNDPVNPQDAATRAFVLANAGISQAYADSHYVQLANVDQSIDGKKTFIGDFTFFGATSDPRSIYLRNTGIKGFGCGYDNTSDSAALEINFYGYQGGFTKYRDFSVGNGRNSGGGLFFDGSDDNGYGRFNVLSALNFSSASKNQFTGTFSLITGSAAISTATISIVIIEGTLDSSGDVIIDMDSNLNVYGIQMFVHSGVTLSWEVPRGGVGENPAWDELRYVPSSGELRFFSRGGLYPNRPFRMILYCSLAPPT